MARLTKPGGWVAIEEADAALHLCYPSHPAWDRLTEVFHAAYRSDGADLFIGRKLAAMLRDTGMVEVGIEARAEVYPHGHSRRTIHPDLVLAMRDKIIERGIADAAELEKRTRGREHTRPIPTLSPCPTCTSWPGAANQPRRRPKSCWLQSQERPAGRAKPSPPVTTTLVGGNEQTATVPAATVVAVSFADLFHDTPGTLIVSKTISGATAGQQALIAILVDCGLPLNQYAFTIPANTAAGTVSRSFPDIPAGLTCTVTETSSGASSAVAVTVTGSGQRVAIPAAGTATATLTDTITAEAPVAPITQVTVPVTG